jgi:flagellar hook-basal body complex protein FliE
MAPLAAGTGSMLPRAIEPQGRTVILGDSAPATRVLQDEPPVEQASAAPSFGDMLSNAIGSVNDLQQQSTQMQQALLNGENVELHDVMIKAEQAGLSMDLLLEIRNRLVNGFNELMRMPI